MSDVVSVKACLHYWRNMLADEDMMGMSGSDSPVRVNAGVVAQGKLDPQSTEKLQKAWAAHKKQVAKDRMAADERDLQATSVPVLIFDKGLSRRHGHGVAFGGGASSSKPRYAFQIPAHLAPDGSLSFTTESPPWIGREFLLPNEDTEDDTPIVGDVAMFDEWLDKHPLEVAEWPDLMRWCAGLWTHVTGNKVPEGFVALDEVRIDIARKTRNYGRNLIRLYDALLAESRTPVLLERLAAGRPNAIVVDGALRRAQLAAPRGTMDERPPDGPQPAG